MNMPLFKEVRVACSPEHAFDVFTARIDLWWPAGHRPRGATSMHLEPRAGGAFYAMRETGERVDLGTVVEVTRPERLTYTWIPGGSGGETLVEVAFVAEPDGTVVRIAHREAESGLGEQWTERVKIFEKSWDDVLHVLADYLIESA